MYICKLLFGVYEKVLHSLYVHTHIPIKYCIKIHRQSILPKTLYFKPLCDVKSDFKWGQFFCTPCNLIKTNEKQSERYKNIEAVQQCGCAACIQKHNGKL